MQSRVDYVPMIFGTQVKMNNLSVSYDYGLKQKLIVKWLFL